MSLIRKLKDIQARLIEQGIDGWLFYDFRHSNPFVYTILEIVLNKGATRRFVYWIPAKGEPVKIVPMIEPHTLEHLPGRTRLYRRWEEFEQQLTDLVAGNGRIAMEFSPRNALPIVSMVDASVWLVIYYLRRAKNEQRICAPQIVNRMPDS